MIFTETRLKGAFVIDLERREDSRGFFARAFCQNEFKAHGLNPIISQSQYRIKLEEGNRAGHAFSISTGG